MPLPNPSSVARRFLAVLAAMALASPVAAQSGPGGPSPVTVITAEAGDFPLTTRLPGRIKASTVAEVRPQVSGIIRERLFDEGATVTEGQPLYKIEDNSYQASVAAAKAAVAQAKANYDLAVTEEARAVDLLASNAASAQRRDSAVASREGADAALQAAQAQLMGAEIDLDRTTIRAPIAGVIGLSQTTTGALVAAQQATPLATIRALDPVYVDVTQSATDILRWRQENRGEGVSQVGEADLRLADNSTYAEKGKLEAAEPQVEPTTGMVTLRMTYPNPELLLLPGMYVEVDLPSGIARDAVALPQSVVMRDRLGNAFVWIVEDGKVVQRPVHIATAQGNTWIVTDGVRGGDQVISSGFQKTAVGAPVQIVPDAAPQGGTN